MPRGTVSNAKMCVVHIFVFLAAGLMAVIFAAKSSARTGIAPPLLLLCLGIAASFPSFIPDVELDPELVLAGFLPPLLFSTASNMPVVDLRRNAGMIIWLSMAMVVLPAIVIGAVIHLVFPEISIALAIALGAVVAPIDAVAATSIGKRLGLPPRLMAVLEGESLFNDASALVTLRTALAALAGSFSLWEAAGSFVGHGRRHRRRIHRRAARDQSAQVARRPGVVDVDRAAHAVDGILHRGRVGGFGCDRGGRGGGDLRAQGDQASFGRGP